MAPIYSNGSHIESSCWKTTAMAEGPEDWLVLWLAIMSYDGEGFRAAFKRLCKTALGELRWCFLSLVIVMDSLTQVGIQISLGVSWKSLTWVSGRREDLPAPTQGSLLNMYFGAVVTGANMICSHQPPLKTVPIQTISYSRNLQSHCIIYNSAILFQYHIKSSSNNRLLSMCPLCTLQCDENTLEKCPFHAQYNLLLGLSICHIDLTLHFADGDCIQCYLLCS